MTLPSLKPAEPRLANAGNGKWDVVWSRAPEVDYLSSLVTTDAPAPRLIVVQNVDSANQKTLVSDLTSRLPSVTNKPKRHFISGNST